MRTVNRWLWVGLLGAIALVPIGCATTYQVTREEGASTLSDAEAALRSARDIDAHTAAPLEMQSADFALVQARQAWAAASYRVASQRAFEATMKARIATAKVRQVQAERQVSDTEREASQTRAEIERLRRDEVTLQSAIEKREALRKITDQARAEAQRAEIARRELEKRVRTALEQITQVRREQRGLVVNLPDILFETGKANLAAGASQKLAQIAATLKVFPVKDITIEGHTDSTGSEEFNLQLSQARAETVRAQLITAGIDIGLIRAGGYGPLRPIAPNTTVLGRQQNRRVEIIVQEREDTTLEGLERLLKP